MNGIDATALVELGLMIPALLSRIAASFIPPDEWLLDDPMLPQPDPEKDAS
jgi:hypothetical protein